MTDTLPTPTPTPARRRPPIALILGIVGGIAIVLLAVLLAISSASFASAKDASDRRERTLTTQLAAEKERVSVAATLLAECSTAYTAQKDVSDRLRGATQDILQGVVDFARYSDNAAFQRTTDDVSDLADGINTDEAAIDSSSCV